MRASTLLPLALLLGLCLAFDLGQLLLHLRVITNEASKITPAVIVFIIFHPLLVQLQHPRVVPDLNKGQSRQHEPIICTHSFAHIHSYTVDFVTIDIQKIC